VICFWRSDFEEPRDIFSKKKRFYQWKKRLYEWKKKIYKRVQPVYLYSLRGCKKKVVLPIFCVNTHESFVTMTCVSKL